MLSRILVVASFALASSGCFLFNGPSDSPPPIEEPMTTTGAAEADWSLDIGGGESAYVPMEDGAHVSVVHGPQGGHHIPVTAHLEGSDLSAIAAKPGSYPSLQTEVVVNGTLQSRSVDMRSPASVTETSADFVYITAFVQGDAHGEATITIKVASEDGTKWAVATRKVVID